MFYKQKTKLFLLLCDGKTELSGDFLDMNEEKIRRATEEASKKYEN